jgi:hypothetical protein
MPDLWTHSLEPQRRLLLHSVKELLTLETRLRRQKLPCSPAELNRRLLLISRLVTATLAGSPVPPEWGSGMSLLGSRPSIPAGRDSSPPVSDAGS